jgi:hypothetical protein
MSENDKPWQFSVEGPDEPQQNLSWTTGLEEDVTHQELIARGAYGEVHKVDPLH